VNYSTLVITDGTTNLFYKKSPRIPLVLTSG